MQNIQLIGAPTEIYILLRDSIQNYLTINKLSVSIQEETSITPAANPKVESSPQIKYLGHTLSFSSITDITLKLPKLYHLLRHENDPDSREKGKCINCDHCKCKK